MLDRSQPVRVLYVNIYPLLLRADEEPLLLLLRRKSDVVLPDVWQPVSGKLRPGEGIAQAFLRQLNDKTGITDTETYSHDATHIYYDCHYDLVMAVPRAIALTTTSPVTIDAELHDEARWVDRHEFRRLVPFVQQADFADLAIDWTLTRDPRVGFHRVPRNEGAPRDSS